MPLPGDTITPENTTDQTVEVSIPRESTAEPEVPKTPAETPAEPVEPTAAPEPAQEPTPDIAPDAPIDQAEPPTETDTEPSTWEYSEESSAQPESVDLDPIDWSASEFVDHEKDTSWFIGFAALTGLAVAIIYLITRELITAAVIVITASLFAVTAKRKPQTLHYQMNRTGVTIGTRFYPYEAFKSFSVLEEGAFGSIQLTPLKRFAIPISLYYSPDDEDRLVNMLGSFLPHEIRTHDPVDRLMRKVRF